MSKTVKYNSTELFNDWFEREKAAADDIRKKNRRKERERYKDADGVSEYWYDLKVRRYIDTRLEKISNLTSQIENLVDSYKDPQKRSVANKNNKKIFKEIGVLESEIKRKDPYFYTFIKKAD